MGKTSSFQKTCDLRKIYTLKRRSSKPSLNKFAKQFSNKKFKPATTSKASDTETEDEWEDVDENSGEVVNNEDVETEIISI